METTTIGRYHIRLPYLSIVKKNNVDSSGMNKKKTHTLYIGKKGGLGKSMRRGK